MNLLRYGIVTCIAAVLLLAACAKDEGVPGRVVTNIGPYVAVVEDCFKPFSTVPQQLEDTPDSAKAYRFVPCTGSDIMILGDQLTVNGSPYGLLRNGDTVAVDHGRVSVNSIPRAVQAN